MDAMSKRLPRLTKTEREALAGKKEQKHRTALSRLRRRPPPGRMIASVVESFEAYERLGHRHVLEDLAEAAMDVLRRRDEKLRSRIRPIGWDRFKDFIREVRKVKAIVLPGEEGEIIHPKLRSSRD